MSIRILFYDSSRLSRLDFRLWQYSTIFLFLRRELIIESIIYVFDRFKFFFKYRKICLYKIIFLFLKDRFFWLLRFDSPLSSFLLTHQNKALALQFSAHNPSRSWLLVEVRDVLEHDVHVLLLGLNILKNILQFFFRAFLNKLQVTNDFGLMSAKNILDIFRL